MKCSKRLIMFLNMLERLSVLFSLCSRKTLIINKERSSDVFVESHLEKVEILGK